MSIVKMYSPTDLVNFSQLLYDGNSQEQDLIVFNSDNMAANNNTSGRLEERNEADISESEAIIICVMFIVILLVSVVVNAFVFLVFWKRKTISISNRFVLNLTVCNILNTVLLIPFALTSLLAKQWVFGSFWCVYTGFMNNTLVSASIFTLAVISIDRYCAVVTPLHYNMRLTHPRCAFLIVSIWSVSILISSPPLFGWNSIEFQLDKMVCTVKWSSNGNYDSYYSFFLISFSFLLPLIAMLWTYFRIFRAVHGNIVRTRRNSIIRGNTSPNGHTDDAVQQTPPLSYRRRSSSVPIIRRLSQTSSRTSSLLWRKEEWKAAVTSFLVLFSFAVCWTPYFVVMAIEAGRSSSYPVPAIVSHVSTVLAMFSHACNPLVYVFRSKMMRKELAVIFRGRDVHEHDVCVPHEVRTRTGLARHVSAQSLHSLPDVAEVPE